MADTAETNNRHAIAEAMAEWAAEHCYTAADVEGIGQDPTGRQAMARLARITHPALPDRHDYTPSDPTWDLTVRLMRHAEMAVRRARDNVDDPFRGFPQNDEPRAATICPHKVRLDRDRCRLCEETERRST